MPRCDYDVVFYRVFCITLLCVAFSFTVILTNVFIDIDGLLYNKEKDKTKPNLERVKGEYEVVSTKNLQDYEDYDYSDTERSKRSLESDEFLQDVRDAKLKKYLRNHFSKYFEVFNFDEGPGNDTDSNKNKENLKNDTENLIKDIQRLKEKKEKKDNKMLHLAIHNIVLQGIVGHMDMKEVYKKAHELAQNLEHSGDKDKLYGENKLINELMDCKDLQSEIMRESIKKANNNTRRTRDKQDNAEKTNNRNIFIKTLINITSLLNDEANQQQDEVNKIDSNLPPGEITGMIKLIYNGRELKFKKMETTTTTPVILTTEPSYLSKTYLNNMLKEYLKQFAKNDDNDSHNIRLKRGADSVTSTKKPNSNEEDELFVEIETHVGTKGMKGEKKKKMIRDLVDKIQKALRSEHEKHDQNKTRKSLHVKKRVQNPLDRNEELIHSIIHPGDKYLHRHSHPISKSVPVHENLPYMTDNQGNNWQKFYSGPHFLDPSKGINSAEMSQVEAVYDKVPDNDNEIHKRLQLPLINEDENYYYNKLGNLRFLIRDIEGSGFSVGYNQYTGEAPDPDSMKLFTGIENVIKSYHRKYDENENTDNQELTGHDIVRRSLKDTDYHSNEYKIIFNNNFLPYNNYQDVTNQRMFKNKETLPLDKAIFIDDSLFDKNLKPAEILSLANFYGRNKRSIKVSKISNIKLHKKKAVNRYLNTNRMASRSVFLHKKRNKRQIDKIRIIARDISPKKSEEDIFVVSDESNYGDRPIIKHNIVQLPQYASGEKYAEPYEVITPSINNADNDDDHIDVLSPYIYEARKENAYDVFSKISRQSSLMSKYPHIFIDDLSRRNDDDDQMDTPTIHSHINDAPISLSTPTPSTTTLATIDTEYYPQNIHKPIISDFASLLDTPGSHDASKQNYKLTIKITPKNSSTPEGFKEIHTSVNKSYNQNGMIYTSMLNVSELSRVEQSNQERMKDSEKDIEAVKLKREKQIKQIKINNMKKLKAEHDKIKKFIDLHKNRLEEQLKMINSEKDKLDKIYQNNEKLLTEHYKNASKDFDLLTEPPTFNISKKVTTEAPTEKTTLPLPSTTTESMEKVLIYNSINKHENVTKEILSKINRNNDLLKTFLEKIIKKLEFSTTTTTETILTTNTPPMGITTTTEWTLPEPYEQMRQMFFKNNPIEVKNDSHYVPFIYMYQHPMNVSQEPANILYQGHIHSELFHKMNKARETDNISRRSLNNQPPIKQYIMPPKPFNEPAVPFNNVAKPFSEPAVPFNNVGKPFNEPAVPFNNFNNNNNNNYNNKINMLPPFNDNIINNNYNNVPVNYIPNKLNTLKQFNNVEKIETEVVKNGTRFFLDDIEREYKPIQNMDNKLQKT